MRNLPKHKRDRLVLIVVSTLIVLVTTWQLLIGYQKVHLKRFQDQLFEKKNRVSNAQRLVKSVDQIRKNLIDRTKELEALEVNMASGDMYSWIITKINKFKAPYEVDIPQFSREVPTKVGMFADFPYQAALFNIRGTAFYHDFGRFLADFENNFPYLRVQNIELEPAGNSRSTTTDAAKHHEEKLSFRMEIVTLINPNAP